VRSRPCSSVTSATRQRPRRRCSSPRDIRRSSKRKPMTMRRRRFCRTGSRLNCSPAPRRKATSRAILQRSSASGACGRVLARSMSWASHGLSASSQTRSASTLVDFLSVPIDHLRCRNSKSYLGPRDAEHGHGHVLADLDCVTDASRQNQHDGAPVRDARNLMSNTVRLNALRLGLPSGRAAQANRRGASSRGNEWHSASWPELHACPCQRPSVAGFAPVYWRPDQGFSLL
jgi:hypothetical protein